jgi:hypothetical protein
VWAFTLITALNPHCLLGRLPIALRCGVPPPGYLVGMYLNQVRTFFAVWRLRGRESVMPARWAFGDGD